MSCFLCSPGGCASSILDALRFLSYHRLQKFEYNAFKYGVPCTQLIGFVDCLLFDFGKIKANVYSNGPSAFCFSSPERIPITLR